MPDTFCADCRCWQPHPRDALVGICHRKSPQPALQPTYPNPPAGMLAATWPATKSSDHCAEGKHRVWLPVRMLAWFTGGIVGFFTESWLCLLDLKKACGMSPKV